MNEWKFQGLFGKLSAGFNDKEKYFGKFSYKDFYVYPTVVFFIFELRARFESSF